MEVGWRYGCGRGGGWKIGVGDGRWEMGDGRWEMGDGRWEVGGGRWEMGDGEWVGGNELRRWFGWVLLPRGLGEVGCLKREDETRMPIDGSRNGEWGCEKK